MREKAATQSIDTSALACGFMRVILTQDDEGDDEARTVRNAMADRGPVVINRWVNTEDVAAVLRLGKRTGSLRREIGMRKLVAGLWLTLDGVMEAPEK